MIHFQAQGIELFSPANLNIQNVALNRGFDMAHAAGLLWFIAHHVNSRFDDFKGIL